MVSILLAGCGAAETDSDVVSDFEKSRSLFGKRVGNDSTEKQKTPTADGNTYFSWSDSEKLKARDGTALTKAKVVNIVDGDTIDIKIDGVQERARVILVNSPESKGKYEKKPQPYAIEAYEFSKAILQDRDIWFETDAEERDSFGRLLVYIWLDNVMFNEEFQTEDGKTYILSEKIGLITLNELLLREGLAHVAIYPPNEKYVDAFQETEKQAKKEGRGIWAD